MALKISNIPGLNFFMVTQETIIYRLVIKNRDFDAFLKKNHIFGGKIGVATTVASKGLGPRDPTKKLTHWVDLLGQLLSRKPVLINFGPGLLIVRLVVRV